MSFNAREHRLLEEFKNNPIGYPFSLSDAELEEMLRAVKRERGNSEAQERRRIRAYVASKFHWHFAMDGGFMPDAGQPGWGNKFWQDGDTPFAKVYHLFEDLVLHLLHVGWTMENLETVYKKEAK